MNDRSDPIHKARWIWCDSQVERTNQYALFRRRVEIPAGAGTVIVQACADLRYWLYVNGRRVGFGPGRYDPRQPQYDTHDVTALVRPGVNIVAFVVHAPGKVKAFVSATPVRAGLIAAVAWSNGAVLTDSTWRGYRETGYAADTPRFSAHQSFIESFDGRVALQGWQREEFDDSGWNAAWELPPDALAPWGQLVGRDVALLSLISRAPARILETGVSIPGAAFDVQSNATLHEMMDQAAHVPSQCVQPNKQGLFPVVLEAPADGRSAAYATFDFAENSAGYITLDVEATPGTIIDLGYGEHLLAGRVPCFKQGIRQGDRYIAGTGRRQHQLMMPKCLRYLQVEVRRGRAVLHGLGQDVSTYPVQWQGSFICEEQPALEAVWRIGAHTVQLCMEDIFMDTPWRERTGWLGDLVPEAMACYYAFGDTDLVRHSLDLFMRSQHEQGWVSGRYPTNLPSNLPTWCASFGMALADYIRHSGDLDFARRIWDGVGRLTDWFERQRTSDDLLVVRPSKVKDEQAGYSGWVLLDWAPVRLEGAISGMNMYYIRYLRDLAWVAQRLGLAPQAAELASLANRTAAAVQRYLFDERRGVFVNCRYDGHLSREAGYQENLLALLWDVATPEQAQRIEQAILKDDRPLPLWVNLDQMNWLDMANGEVPWESDELVPIGSPFFDYFALGALFEVGRARAAMNSIADHYGTTLASGATTTWEEWGGASSHSHGWGAAPTYLAGRYLLGVEPVEPGFSRFRVCPSFGGLSHASGRVPSPHGVIVSQWRREKDGDVLIVEVPQGTIAEAGLPGAPGSDVLSLNNTPAPARPLELRRGRYLVVDLPPGRHELRRTSKG